MAPHVSSPARESETLVADSQRPSGGRDVRPDSAEGSSRGPLIAVAVAVAMSAAAIAWLLVAGSADDEPSPDAVEVVTDGDVTADPGAVNGSADPAGAGDEPVGSAEGSGNEVIETDEPVSVTDTTPVAASDASADGAADEPADVESTAGSDEGSETDAPAAIDVESSDAAGDATAAEPEPELVLEPQSRAVFRDGQVILFGAVPSREIADEIFDLAASVLGPENVVDQYEIDPTVPPPTTGNLTVEETIEFGSGAAVLPDPVPDILPVGVALMAVRPTAELRLIGHTDGRGSEAANLELSLARAEAVKAYFVENGIDPDRIETVGMGESRPVASDDTADGRRENRRIEFEVSNILSDGS